MSVNYATSSRQANYESDSIDVMIIANLFPSSGHPNDSISLHFYCDYFRSSLAAATDDASVTLKSLLINQLKPIKRRCAVSDEQEE